MGQQIEAKRGSTAIFSMTGVPMCRKTGAAAGHYGRTQELHSPSPIMGPHLTTTYGPTSPAIFSLDLRPVLGTRSCACLCASVQMSLS